LKIQTGIFGAIGVCEQLTGKAYGEVDPQLPANAIIQDINLAPRKAKAMVEYASARPGRAG
jgi:hypothetical protein